jgi:hypothetical protein
VGWFLLGVLLSFLLFLGWALCFIGGDADERALAEYERQRAEFESWFE